MGFMRVAVVVSTVVAACALVTGCGGQSASVASGEPIGARELAASGSTSANATSGRFSFDVSATFPGADERFSLSGEGAFDAASQRSSIAVDMSSLARLLGGFVAGLGVTSDADLPDFDDPSGWQVEIVQDGDVEYARVPAMDTRLPEGKKWVRATESSAGDGFDFGALEDAAETDPREVLDTLATLTGDVETLGTQELHGVETTHYRAAIDPAALAKAKDREGQGASQSLVDRLTTGVEEVPVDVWIGADGLVRKLSVAFSAQTPSTAQAGEGAMTFELWDYNQPVTIELPPADDVVAASALRS